MRSKNNIIFSLLFLLLPYLLFIQASPRIRIMTLICLSVLYIFSGYISSIKYLFNSLEFIALFFLLNYLFLIVGIDSIIPLTRFLTILFFYLYVVYIKRYGPVKNIFKAGRLKESWGLSVILTIGSLTGLFFWFYHQANNPWAEMIPHTSIVFLILMGAGFAVLNSIYEEGLFRGILLTLFTKATNFYIALFLQAVWFSFMHYRAGFPSGFAGLILTFIFGVFTGILVKRSQSIFVPVIIHAISDFFIFILILSRTKGLI